MEDGNSSNENSALLGDPPEATARNTKFRRRRSIFCIYLIFLFYALGEYLQYAPRTQIYESIVCRDYYARSARLGTLVELDCKVRPVQEELVALRGIERLTELVPTLTTIWYGLLAQRWGSSTVLILALCGTLLAQIWAFAVCWFSEYVPIHILWAQYVFELIGGGPSVASTMLFLVIVNMVDQNSRTNVFFRVHAVVMFASTLGPGVSSIFMRKSDWLPWAVAIMSELLSVLLAFLIHRDVKHSILVGPQTVSERASERAVHEQSRGRFLERIRGWHQLARQAIKAVSEQRQVALLLAMSPIGQIAHDSLHLMLLLYVSKRYGWTFAEAAYLRSYGSFVDVVSLTVIMPLLSAGLNRVRNIQPSARDRWLLMMSLALLGLGSVCLGTAWNIELAILGITLMSTSTAVIPLIRSLLTRRLKPEHLNTLYCTLTMLTMAGSSLAGPVYSETFSVGLRMGSAWYGLAYIVAGALAILVLVMAILLEDQESYAQPIESN